MLRAPYLRQRVSAATRAMRMEYAEDGVDEWLGPDASIADREVGALDLIAVRGGVEVTGQGGTRLDANLAVALFGVVVRFPEEVVSDVIAYEARSTERPGGEVAHTGTFWIMRAETDAESTGSRYEISLGFIVHQDTPAGRPREIDHRSATAVGGLGWFSDTRRPYGWGAQFLCTPYVTMAGEPALEDRGFVAGWHDVRGTRLAGRMFVAHTGRRQLYGTRRGDWTGGVELDARRDVGRFALGVRAESGHSFYAALDGAAPNAGFGARAALTLQRSSSRRWFC